MRPRFVELPAEGPEENDRSHVHSRTAEAGGGLVPCESCATVLPATSRPATVRFRDEGVLDRAESLVILAGFHRGLAHVVLWVPRSDGSGRPLPATGRSGRVMLLMAPAAQWRSMS